MGVIVFQANLHILHDGVRRVCGTRNGIRLVLNGFANLLSFPITPSLRLALMSVAVKATAAIPNNNLDVTFLIILYLLIC